MENDDVMHVTALTPDPAAIPESQPDPVSEQAPAAPPEDSGEEQLEEHPADLDSDEATAQAPAAPDGQQKKPSRGVQKALDRLTDRAVRAEQLAATLADAMARQQPQAAPQAPPISQDDLEPTPEKFSSWDDYTRAVAKWNGRREAQQVMQTQMTNFVGALVGAQQQSAAAASAQALNQRIAQATEKAPERIPDWDDVVASDLPLTPTLHRAIARAPDPALAMHYLATHPDEHMKLVRMAPEDAAFVAGQLFAPSRSARSNAPAPAKTVGGRSSGANAYRDDFTPVQHKAWLARQAKG